jgi:hypothetical protein
VLPKLFGAENPPTLTIRQEPEVPDADRAAREAAPPVTNDREHGRCWHSSVRSATAWEDAPAAPLGR